MPSRSATRPASARIARKSDGEPEAALSRRGLERLGAGHVWVYRADLRAPAELKGGEVVRLVDDRGWCVGKAFYGKQSQISVRLLTREDEPIDDAFFARRLAQARALRDASAPDPDLRRAGRMVHGEADLLPGLVVDRYADCLVVQTLIEATDARRELFAGLLQDLGKPRAIVERNDVKVRAHEGLPARKGLLRGAEPGPVEFLEGEVKLVADLLEGQKTGAFLDQAENRIEAGRYARGRALDCFTYGGAFALPLARRAEAGTALGISERAAEPARGESLEGEVKLVAALLEGQKTGAFLDQAENRIEAGRYARGRALDCFTYGGAFALQLARRAEAVTAVDISERAAEEGRRTAARNGATNVTFQVANAFDLLRDQADEGQIYDTIVLDPPALAKSKA